MHDDPTADNLHYDIISHLPHQTTLAGDDADDAPDVTSAPMSPSGVAFLVRTAFPAQPASRPSSAADFSTEYRRNFRPFDAFKYVDGAFKENRGMQQEDHSPSQP